MFRRPTPGRAEVNSILAEYLLNYKDQLQKDLGNLEEESTMLKAYVKNFQKETQHQLTEIHTLEQISLNQ